MILLKFQVLQSVNFLLFSLYFTHCFAHYLRINLAYKMSLLLYWVTYVSEADTKCLKDTFINPIFHVIVVSINFVM